MASFLYLLTAQIRTVSSQHHSYMLVFCLRSDTHSLSHQEELQTFKFSFSLSVHTLTFGA